MIFMLYASIGAYRKKGATATILVSERVHGLIGRFVFLLRFMLRVIVSTSIDTLRYAYLYRVKDDCFFFFFLEAFRFLCGRPCRWVYDFSRHFHATKSPNGHAGALTCSSAKGMEESKREISRAEIEQYH